MLFYPPIELFILFFFLFFFTLISPIFVFLSSEHQCYIGLKKSLLVILLLEYSHAYVLLLEHCHFVCFQFFFKPRDSHLVI